MQGLRLPSNASFHAQGNMNSDYISELERRVTRLEQDLNHANNKAEVYRLEKEAMEGKFRSPFSEIEALRSSWKKATEEIRVLRVTNDTITATNNCLKLECRNMSFQIEQSMKEASTSQVCQ